MSPPASVGDGERLRLFVALRLPDPTVAEIVRWQESALPAGEGMRRVPPENLHITLAFLGSRPADERDRIHEAVWTSAAAAGPITLGVRRYHETQRVGMLVLDDEAPTRQSSVLAQDVQRRLAALGVYRPESRPWKPHVTVLRFRRRPRLAPELPALGPVSPSEVALYHSVLRRDGARYEVLESADLGG